MINELPAELTSSTVLQELKRKKVTLVLQWYSDS